MERFHGHRFPARPRPTAIPDPVHDPLPDCPGSCRPCTLEFFGLLIGRRRENQQYFTGNHDFFLYNDLQQPVLKTEGVAWIIQENLSSLQNIECILIYGSFAKGTAVSSTGCATNDIVRSTTP